MQRLPGFNQLWPRPFPSFKGSFEELPLSEVEDSILLRVLVQALVVVGIVAIDVAAQTQFSLWAVPLSIAGATWSWYQRRARNVPVKFLLAILMLGAMALFFNNLFGQLNDTRLVLAELLIQLQVLHSFDLPRRKDLGYSMVIGLILIGVAGTISQTLAFAPVLLVFLAMGLPVLVLDYRSRLGLLSRHLSASGVGTRHSSSLNSQFWKRLGVLFLVILGLGLTIFALMPRFPGYQVQTSFAVSAPPNLQQKDFAGNNAGIVKPGRKKGNGSGAGNGEQGEEDNTIPNIFSSKMNQSKPGELKPQVVMRVRSQAEGFWRVLAFDRYTGQGWEITREKDATPVKRPEWSYRFFLPAQITVGKTRDVVQTYTMVADLPNLIPALAYPRELYFPTQRVAVDKEGSVRAPGVLQEGLTYTVISEVPYRDRTLLGKAPTDYSKNIRNLYLQIPPQIADKVRQKTQEFLSKSPKPITSPYEQALYLAQYLKQHYTIPKDPLGLPLFAENEDLVEAFLFKNEGGYPDHFSTVLTIMLRSIGIPARLVGGFAPGQFNPFTGMYVVSNTDAYTMAEVYFPKYGWFTFDPIPGHDLIPPSIEDDQTFSVLREFWKWVAGWLPSPVTSWVGRVFEAIGAWLVGSIIWLWAILSNGWVGAFTGLVLAIALLFLGWLGWQQWKRWRYRRWLAKLPPMESLYQQMLSTLAAKGYAKHPAQTPLEYAKASHEHHSSPLAEVIEEISQAYVRWRYGSVSPNLKQLRQRLQELKKRPVVRR